MLSAYTQQIANEQSLAQLEFSCLDLASYSIAQINLVSAKFIFLSELNLDNNLLLRLTGIEQFMSLEVFSFNFNFIQEKTELLKIKCKFMLKSLSFIGNRIENTVSEKWLAAQGFSSLTGLNQIFKIHRTMKSQRYYPKDLSVLLDQNREIKSVFNNTKLFPGVNQNFLFSIDPYNLQKQHSKSFSSNSHILNPPFLDFTQKKDFQSISKSKSRLVSTEDTKRKNISFQKFGEGSNFKKSWERSPHFNKIRKNQLHQSAKINLLSTKKRKISEFILFPVNQEKNNYRSNLRPFHYTESASHARMTRTQQTNSAQINEFKHLTTLKSSDTSDNYIIEKQIPAYKTAIAIAFYYRNLLQKVFVAFTKTAQQKQKFYPQSQNSSISLGQDNQQSLYVNEIKQQKNFYQAENQKACKQILKLKKYVWMKLELFANYKKITQKYLRKSSQMDEL